MDKTVYFYKEGMAAPMGSFSNYGCQPRAVLVVDRSLRERGSPGVYETTVRLRKPGEYDVVFFLELTSDHALLLIDRQTQCSPRGNTTLGQASTSSTWSSGVAWRWPGPCSFGSG